MASKELSICTYNCNLFNDRKIEFCRKLFDKTDILLIQEHGLYQSKFDNLLALDKCCSYVASSAMSEHVPLYGRPHGGTSIMWRSNIKYEIQKVSCSSVRMCSIQVLLGGGRSLLVFSVYMPCDNQGYGANLEEFKEVLNEICIILLKLSPTHFVIAGDFNSDFSRNSPQVKELQAFLIENACSIPINANVSKVAYTYMDKNGSCASTLDHILISESLVDEINSYYTWDDIDNCSDHLPVICELNLPINLVPFCDKKPELRLNWQHASADSIAQYKEKLDEYLDAHFIPSSCNNMLCSSSNCKQDILSMYNAIVNACTVSADLCIPKFGTDTQNRGSKVIPGWSDIVEPARNKAIFWHKMWIDNNRPQSGVISEIRRKTRADYHRNIKVVKRNSEKLRHIKMAEDIASNNSRNLWQEIKRIKGCNKSLPMSIDGVFGDKNIADAFADKFEKIYNSVSYDSNELDSIKCSLESEVKHKCACNKCNCHLVGVTLDMVKTAIKSLKRCKKDGTADLFSDNYLFGTNKLYYCISVYFTCVLSHGYSPVQMLGGTIVPIPKIKGTSKLDNFRGITLGSMLCKILEIIIL